MCKFEMPAWNMLRRGFSTFSNGHTVLTASRLFLPTRDLPDVAHENTDSYKYLLKAGFIRQSFSGGYYLLPLAQRCLTKLMNLIDNEMSSVGGVKMTAPILAPAHLWKTSGRWESTGKELFHLMDQNDSEFCLGPTHEELFTDLVAQEVSSHRQLPLRLYQIDRKFRDEKRPRYGLLRAREFWMKDMYTFDVSPETALESYEQICLAYERIFTQLELQVSKVKADPGNIGGSLSHEYHVMSPMGEDTLIICDKCGRGFSSELISIDSQSLPDCPFYQNVCPLKETRGIEVAHSFYLGTKYSSVFKASFTNEHSQKQLCQMGCYGVGVSRLLQAIVEYNLIKYSGKMIWPLSVAPVKVCVTPLIFKKASNEFMNRAMNIYNALQSHLPGDVLLDDRVHLTIGDRLRHIEMMAYPFAVLIGPKNPENHVELQTLCRDQRTKEIISESSLVDVIRERFQI